LKDKQGMSAFHHCCHKKNRELILLLYNNGADINSICKNDFTPLHWACDSSSPDIAMMLINMGANIDLKDNEGRTPLIWAIDRNHNDLVKELIRKGADINVVDRYKKTALHWSCVRENIELIRLLLSKGLDINDRDVNGITALNLAVDANRIDIVEILLDNGADVFLQDRRELTPLIHAVKNGYVDIIEAIIQKGGKRIMYQGDNLLCKPLHWACLYGQLESIKILYDYGVYLNDQNNYQKTPLFFASRNGYSNCVEYLVERGANVYVKDSNHRLPFIDDKIIETFNSIWYTTPLMKAMIDGNIYEFRRLLCTENYEEINQIISDRYGYTVLHAAVHLGELRFVEAMTRYENVDFTKSTGSKGLSALHIACSKGDINMIKLIRKRLIIE
jgi:ankyrin repeat protein